MIDGVDWMCAEDLGTLDLIGSWVDCCLTQSTWGWKWF